MSVSVAIIGECMLELTHAGIPNSGVAKLMKMGYGGDTINTSIYLSRNDIAVSYITGLGDDKISDWLLEEWLVARMSNSVPGIYMINIDEDGERSFLYWRKDSPASRLIDDADYAAKLSQSITAYDYLYLSGISLAILKSESRERLFDLLEKYREQGGKLIFDGNYRPNLWPSSAVTQQAYAQMYRMTDVALPTFEDEALLFGFESAEQVLQSIQDYGVSEIVVKMGVDGCLALHDGIVNYVAAPLVDPVDTTAAGDSFNAGYLAARLKACSGIDACSAGHTLASKVIQHSGAIIPTELKSS